MLQIGFVSKTDLYLYLFFLFHNHIFVFSTCFFPHFLQGRCVVTPLIINVNYVICQSSHTDGNQRFGALIVKDKSKVVRMLIPLRAQIMLIMLERQNCKNKCGFFLLTFNSALSLCRASDVFQSESDMCTDSETRTCAGN